MPLPINIDVGLFGIYRDASDLTHGSFFGALLWLGQTQPAKSPRKSAELSAEHRGMICMLLLLLGLSINSLIYILGEKFALPGLRKESDEIRELYYKDPWFSGDHDSTSSSGPRGERRGFNWTVGDGSGKES